MSVAIMPLDDKLLLPTKELIAEVVLEFYGDLEFLPKSKNELLKHYTDTGYLKDLDEHRSEYSRENGAFFVLSDGGAVVGCGGVRRLGSQSGELVRLWLKQEMRGRGLGLHLLRELVRVASAIPYQELYLDTSHRCSDAVRLFKRNGFVECGKYKESIGDIFLKKEMKETP